MMSDDYDAVVIGLGGVGSFCLRALSKANPSLKVLGVERFERGHSKGSSHGETRVFRRAYFEDAGYIPWIDYSIQEWEALERETGLSLINKCGNLILRNRPDTTNTKEKNYLLLAHQAAIQHNIPIELLNQEELQKRFPQFQYNSKSGSANWTGLWEPGAGYVRPELSMEAALKQAQENPNITVLEHTQVLHMVEKESDLAVEVTLLQTKTNDKMTVKAKKVLLAAGAWTSQLVPSWEPYLAVTRQVQGWIDVSNEPNPQQYLPGQLPTWILDTVDYHLPMFGIPAVPSESKSDQQYFIKIGVHNHVDKIDDPGLNASGISKEEIQEYLNAVQVALANTNVDTLTQTIPCLYTMTPDHDFLVGVPQEYQNVYAIAGLSGHGFKMAPALGRILADFALIGEAALNNKWHFDRFCSCKRFTDGKP